MKQTSLNKVSLNVISLNKVELNSIGEVSKRPTTPIEYEEAYDANGVRLYDANDRALFVRKS